MWRVKVTVLGFMLIPRLIMADDVLFHDQTKHLVDSTSSTPTTILQSGPISLEFLDKSIQSIALENYPDDLKMKSSFFVSVAEASVSSVDSIMNDYMNAQAKIRQAKSLNDLQSLTTPGFVLLLREKVVSGANELMVLKTLQTLRPDHIKIVDVRRQNDQGKLAVTGHSFAGPVQGVAYMIQENDHWKIDRETWFSVDKTQVIQQEYPLSFMKLPTNINDPYQNSALAILDTPEYKFDRNTLHLQRARPNIRKRSFMFIFYMNKKEPIKQVAGASELRPTAPLHILWTGPNQMVPEQKVVKYEYPIDFSIADDKDGYMPGNLNLHLPRKRPNGVTLSAMWSF